ncbi:hypothetical protein BGX38DRAFT_1180522 [Terfezia claveryi]|nr:hypothetical protein BGX38DRAFT_1180522 [Terfezia claveryi]
MTEWFRERLGTPPPSRFHGCFTRLHCAAAVHGICLFVEPPPCWPTALDCVILDGRGVPASVVPDSSLTLMLHIIIACSDRCSKGC